MPVFTWLIVIGVIVVWLVISVLLFPVWSIIWYAVKEWFIYINNIIKEDDE